MSTEKSHADVEETARVNVDEPFEAEFWSKELGVTEDRLREMVKAAAPRSF